MEGNGPPGMRQPCDVTATQDVIRMLQENMRYLEDMEEEKMRMQQEKEDMKQQLEEQMEDMVDKFLEEKRSLGEKLAIEKEAMKKEQAKFRAECEANMNRQKEEMDQKIAEAKAIHERLERENMDANQKMVESKKDFENTQQRMNAEMERKSQEFKLEMDRQEALKNEEMQRKIHLLRTESQEVQQEMERMQKMKEEDMQRKLTMLREETEKRMMEEEIAMRKQTADLRAAFAKEIQEEKFRAEARLADTRAQTEMQLRLEREVTDAVKQVLRELPPLQTAMELGDIQLLEKELDKWKDEKVPERFGECKGVVEAVVKLAQERFVTWRSVEHTWKDVLREIKEGSGQSINMLTQQCQRLFRALKEAQLTKLDLSRSDPEAMDKATGAFLKWSERAMSHCNVVQKLIVKKVVTWPNLGPFDFADLDICLRLVDRKESEHAVFLTRAQALVEDKALAPKELRHLLSYVETMLFFLKYAKYEDVSLTHSEFRKQPDPNPLVSSYLNWAKQEYGPTNQLVQLTPQEDQNLMNGKDATTVLEKIRRPPSGQKDSLGYFREIFYQWALAMRDRFGLLALPHHTQVVCLLAFRRFLEDPVANPNNIRSLIAQVGTGEGKSMIVAALAVYIVVALKKKVHVVVDDETLLERDFWSFKRLFDAFGSKQPNGSTRPINSVLCVSEERVAAASSTQGASMSARVDPDADICYCEAKHVQSFYAGIARGARADFEGYKNRVLILDEVDALVIDEEPNEAFVYPNVELSKMATYVAECLKRGDSTQQICNSTNLDQEHPSAARVVNEMSKEWERGREMVSGEDFIYAKELGKYCALQAGRANPKSWSLALECRNFQDGLSREILFKERLFVMSRPRVFRKYHRILGLSGSIGSRPERAFLQETYQAGFFEVPQFLKTCKGAPFHEAVAVPLGQQRKSVYVEPTPEAQMARLTEVALEARERVPVLIIAKDRTIADQVVEALKAAGRLRGLGGACDDVIRSLSRTLYEADPEQWKENLNRSTMPLGDKEARQKSWRVTVTDPRGGRGLDYRVDDESADAAGGLLLIPLVVPTSSRDWIQFLGRTARQDRHGQYCAVLCSRDYEALSSKYAQPLSTDGSLAAVNTILSWGEKEAAERIRGSAALYNCGVRMNELCEEVFGKRRELIENSSTRQSLVDICQRYRWMSVKEVTEAFKALPGLNPEAIKTEAKDLGRPSEPPANFRPSGLQTSVGAGGGGFMARPKILLFCLDWSASMMSRDCGTAMNRFQTCTACVQRLLRDQVMDNDLVGIVCFGPQVTTVVPPMRKGAGHGLIESRLASLQPQAAGGTCFYDAVAECLQLLHQPGVPLEPNAQRWLVCLTDGDDMGSKRDNAQGQLVTQMVNAGFPQQLNMAMITVGSMQEQNVRIIQSWCERVSASGGLGKHLEEQNAGQIAEAFDVIAEYIAAEVGGATEC